MFFHDVKEREVHVSHRQCGVYVVALSREIVLYVAHLRGAGGDEYYSDIVVGKLGMLLLCFFSRKIRRNVDGRENRHYVIAQKRIIHADHSRYRGAGGAYYRFLYVVSLDVQPCVCRNQLGGAGNLKHVVKSHYAESAEDVTDIVHVVELTVERRRGKCDFILVV